MMKKCTKCLVEKNYEMFHKDASRNDGYRNQCKECVSGYMKTYHVDNQEKIIKRVVDWVANNRDKHNQKCAKWVKNNRGKVNARTARRYAAKTRATPKWALNNPDYMWMINEAYDLAQLRNKITGGLWEVDHIVPLRGKDVSGLHVPWNLRVVLQKENRVKSNRLQEAL